MLKKIKMVIYAEPGTGKSVFAAKSEKPFFICTDGNYEWLDEWGAKPEDHVEVSSWEEAKKAFRRDFSNYETIVIDLTEDLFKWCEYEFCLKNGLAHVSDLGYGKGYDTTRNEFFIEISKLLSLDKNVILIMHGLTITVKDRRGVEYTKYCPTNRIPDKVIDMIEGRVRYFLRAFAITEEDKSGHLVTKRYLSLSPDGTTEFGIARGLNSENTPRNIPLEWSAFRSVVESSKSSTQTEQPKSEVKVEQVVEKKVEEPKVEPKQEEVKPANSVLSNLIEDDELDEITEPKVKTPVVEEPKKVEPKAELKQEEVVKQPQSQDDKIAAIKAKLAALKGNK